MKLLNKEELKEFKEAKLNNFKLIAEGGYAGIDEKIVPILKVIDTSKILPIWSCQGHDIKGSYEAYLVVISEDTLLLKRIYDKTIEQMEDKVGYSENGISFKDRTSFTLGNIFLAERVSKKRYSCWNIGCYSLNAGTRDAFLEALREAFISEQPK